MIQSNTKSISAADADALFARIGIASEEVELKRRVEWLQKHPFRAADPEPPEREDDD